MRISVGRKIWIPCEVRPGPFSDERLVRVASEAGEWVGFVNIRWLKDAPGQGADQVLATVLEVKGDTFVARIRGHAPTGPLFEGQTSRATRGEAIQA